jgi:hypothetical protein
LIFVGLFLNETAPIASSFLLQLERVSSARARARKKKKKERNVEQKSHIGEQSESSSRSLHTMVCERFHRREAANPGFIR